MGRYMEEILVLERRKIISIWITMQAKQVIRKIRDNGQCLVQEEFNQQSALREDSKTQTTKDTYLEPHVEHKTSKPLMVDINMEMMWSSSTSKLTTDHFSKKINMSKTTIKMRIHMMNSLRRKLKHDSLSSLRCKISFSFLRMIQLISKIINNNKMVW